jgi:hypothetical protein
VVDLRPAGADIGRKQRLAAPGAGPVLAAGQLARRRSSAMLWSAPTPVSFLSFVGQVSSNVAAFDASLNVVGQRTTRSLKLVGHWSTSSSRGAGAVSS